MRRHNGTSAPASKEWTERNRRVTMFGMKYRRIGRWGVKLSVIGLGSYLTIGYKVDEETARKTVRTAYDAGVNFFDTADAYNRGKGEIALGRCLRDFRRSSYFLLTKC